MSRPERARSTPRPCKISPKKSRSGLFTRHPATLTMLAVGIAFGLMGVGYFYFSDHLPRIDPTDGQQVQKGSKLYAVYCASCHGASLEGQANWQRRLPNGRLPAPPHDASGHTWHHPDEMLFRVTKFGSATYNGGRPTDMPGFEGRLSDSEIAAILAYIKSTWPPDIRARQARINASAPNR
jgi:mono/diheme cytochrome c family protein